MTRAVAAGAWLVAAAILVSAAGCGGGRSRVPASPEAVLARAQEYHQKGKRMQAATLYREFLDRYAGHDQADFAQFMLAEAYFEDSDYAIAATEYQILMSNFGYSEHVEDALFRIGVCYWRESPRASRDQKKSVDALSRFNQYKQMFPAGKYAAEVDGYIVQIHEKLAKKEFGAARWYYRQKNRTAALIYCDKIIENFPDNRYWAEALFLKGEILLRNGEKEEAIRQFTRVIEYPGDLQVKREAEARIRKARQ